MNGEKSLAELRYLLDEVDKVHPMGNVGNLQALTNIKNKIMNMIKEAESK